MKNYVKVLFSIIVIFSNHIHVFAQAGPGGPPLTPIDGGLSVLLVAGGIYGVKKIRDHYK